MTFEIQPGALENRLALCTAMFVFLHDAFVFGVACLVCGCHIPLRVFKISKRYICDS